MTNTNTVKLTIDSVNYEFTKGTYNGTSAILERQTGYVNASSFCKQYNKRIGRFFETEGWKEYIKEFCNEYKANSEVAKMPCHENSSDWWRFKLHAGIPKQHQELRGIYVDPRLINYIAEWCSPKYAIRVAKLLDSINTSVHKQLEEKKLEDNVENSKKLFISTCETIVDVVSNNDVSNINEAFENQFSWVSEIYLKVIHKHIMMLMML